MNTSRRSKRWRAYIILVAGLILLPVSAGFFAIGLITVAVHGQWWLVLVPLLAMFASLAAIVAGWLMTSGRKRLVLFLRRFGNEALNDAVRELIRKELKGQLRLVTLDDSAFQPAGPRWRSLLYSLLPPTAIVAAIAYFFGAGYERTARSELMDGTPFGAGMALLMVFMYLMAAVVFVVALLFGAAAVRTHFIARREIRDERSRTKVVRRLKRFKSVLRSPGFAAPMATVVTSSDEQWQAAVKDIGSVSHVALVDISTPRENVCWEIEALARQPVKMVLLADRRALTKWWDEAPAREVDGLARRMRQLAEGRTLVLYETADRLSETELADILASST